MTYYPEKNDFLKIAKKGTVIPVFREIVADTETPVSAYSKVSGKYSFLLESVEGGENIARYSIIGTGPYKVFESKGRKIKITSPGKQSTQVLDGDPFAVLKELMSEYRSVKHKGAPRFHGGAVGYIGYDSIRFIEDIPDSAPDELNVPDILMMLSDTILLFDHVKHKIMVFAHARIGGDPSSEYDKAVRRIDTMIDRLRTGRNLKPLETGPRPEPLKITSNMTKQAFTSMVRKAKDYILKGDIIQVVLSQRITARSKADTFDMYRSLRMLNPSPYMYYFDMGDFKVIGSSPEIMVRLEGKKATVRPIAGTALRGSDDDEDAKISKALLSDPKEKAEHIMLVDLARNDLGRVCTRGSVKVDELMEVEKYSHVMHIVSNVTGDLDIKHDAFSLFRASFPAGTVSGAPKVRAMQIIDELENTKRGIYAGAVGYFDFDGNLDSCIAIRTIVVKNGSVHIQAGAGIVADSVPLKEYNESLNKARALIKAVEMVS